MLLFDNIVYNIRSFNRFSTHPTYDVSDSWLPIAFFRRLGNITYKFFQYSFATIILVASCYSLILLFKPPTSYLDEDHKQPPKKNPPHNDIDHYS